MFKSSANRLLFAWIAIGAMASACSANRSPEETTSTTSEALLVHCPPGEAPSCEPGPRGKLVCVCEPIDPPSPPGDLVTVVDGFRNITSETFAPTSGDVLDACITPGTHRVMRFDFHSKNIGSTDVHLGSPPSDITAHSPLFVYSYAHGHWHIRDFNVFSLTDLADTTIGKTGLKQAFCLEDYDRTTSSAPPKYTCSDQGVSPGWEDTYRAGLPCQFINVDGIGDGVYLFKAKTNASKVAAESNYDNNETSTYLRIAGNAVSVTTSP